MYYIASKKEFAMLKNHNKHLYCRLELLDVTVKSPGA